MTQELGPNQKAWLAALRSGEYKQTKNVLHDGVGYCCLGVACVIAGLEPTQLHDDFLFGDNSLTPPHTVWKNFLALHDRAGNPRGLGGHKLTALNDGDRNEETPYEWVVEPKTFAEIADIIEKDPSIYFSEPR